MATDVTCPLWALAVNHQLTTVGDQTQIRDSIELMLDLLNDPHPDIDDLHQLAAHATTVTGTDITVTRLEPGTFGWVPQQVEPRITTGMTDTTEWVITDSNHQPVTVSDTETMTEWLNEWLNRNGLTVPADATVPALLDLHNKVTGLHLTATPTRRHRPMGLRPATIHHQPEKNRAMNNNLRTMHQITVTIGDGALTDLFDTAAEAHQFLCQVIDDNLPQDDYDTGEPIAAHDLADNQNNLTDEQQIHATIAALLDNGCGVNDVNIDYHTVQVRGENTLYVIVSADPDNRHTTLAMFRTETEARTWMGDNTRWHHQVSIIPVTWNNHDRGWLS